MLNIFESPKEANKELLNKIYLETFKVLEVESINVDVTFVSSDIMQKINFEHRGMNKPTDVLSFNYDKGLFPNSDDFIEGEIFVCMDKVITQAAEKEHSIGYEINFLFSHGMLHLMGFDHQTDKQETEMNKYQMQILKEIEK
jgi:probable rRNA maturation factor